MTSHEYQVYLLRNTKGSRYIGITEDVTRRVHQHNAGVSVWTRHRGPWTLEWTSLPMPLSEARKLENLLKRQRGGTGLNRLLTRHGSSGS